MKKYYSSFLLYLFLSSACYILLPGFIGFTHAEPRHAIAIYGEPRLSSDFKSFAYVNPEAPKGGKITIGFQGTFDTLNPLIPKGVPMWWVNGYVWQRLMQRNYDEPYTLYGLLAETVEMPDDRQWIQFNINPKATFSDGKPVTADDVLFTWELLTKVGRPNFRNYAKLMESVEKINERSIRFTFKGEPNWEMPLNLGLMPVLPKHAIDPDRFAKTSLTPPIGSGPYSVEQVDPGAKVVLRRNPNYWAKDLPVHRGMFNFDEMQFDFYRDASTMFEAFKKGLFDINIIPDGDPTHWERAYDFPAVRDGRVIKEAFSTGLPKSPAGFVFNTRRARFSDPNVREALSLMFDFEWINKNLFYGLYERTRGYFDGSYLSSIGIPASDKERTILATHDSSLRTDVMDGAWRPPHSDGSGRDRKTARKALSLLEKAGWRLDGTKLVDANGDPFSFEFLAVSSDQERIALPYKRALQRIGVTMTIRLVDSAQYQERLRRFDFDMIRYGWFQSLSPGIEQKGRWSMQSANVEGSFNFAGVRDPASDAAINALLAARNTEDFVAAARALDRALISGMYMVPLFHTPKQWVAHWARIKHPEKTSLFGFQLAAWWAKEVEVVGSEIIVKD